MEWKSCVGKPKSSFGDVIVRVIETKEVLTDVWEYYDDHLTMVQRGNHYNGDTYYYKDLQWLDESDKYFLCTFGYRLTEINAMSKEDLDTQLKAEADYGPNEYVDKEPEGSMWSTKGGDHPEGKYLIIKGNIYVPEK